MYSLLTTKTFFIATSLLILFDKTVHVIDEPSKLHRHPRCYRPSINLSDAAQLVKHEPKMASVSRLFHLYRRETPAVDAFLDGIEVTEQDVCTCGEWSNGRSKIHDVMMCRSATHGSKNGSSAAFMMSSGTATPGKK